ncbi:hypothetical protein [Streptomyces sp. TP-A0874]|uniref:hypothetical protein n=1 Tax=Streptomyces sp. TP-A0874 TaxID=549819 RepID=UPI00085290D2|nr:hypothetical protein [Streptomyces sp. TP-A0874]
MDLRTPAETPEALARLRELRGPFLRERRKNRALTLYAGVLLAVGWGLPTLVRLGREEGPGGAIMGRVLNDLPLFAPILALLTLLLMARAAVWRGPVLADGPTLHWLLPTPLPRGPVLLPALRASALLVGAIGIVAGATLGWLLGAHGAGSRTSLVLAGAWAGIATALTGTGLGVLVERHERLMLRQGARIFGVAWTALGALALWHALLPVALLVAGTALGGAAAALLGRAWPGLAVLYRGARRRWWRRRWSAPTGATFRSPRSSVWRRRWVTRHRCRWRCGT